MTQPYRALDTPRYPAGQKLGETEPQLIERLLAEERRGAPPDVLTETVDAGPGGLTVVYVEDA